MVEYRKVYKGCFRGFAMTKQTNTTRQYNLHPKQQEVLDRVINLLENQNLTWLKSWANGSFKNYITKKEYRGINVFVLNINNIIQNFKSPYYLTFLQIKKLNAHLNKDSKSTAIFYYEIKQTEIENKDTGEKEIRTHPILRCYNVFNIEQTNITIPQDESKQDLKPIEKCELIINNYKDKPIIEIGLNPCYIPKDDKIKIPSKNDFIGIEEYYSTIYHELSHSTGHEKRLKREGIINATTFKTDLYSKEEVIAELSTAFLCSNAGIENNTLNNSTAYIQGWIQNLKEDKTFLFKVIKDAQKSADYIIKGVEVLK
jgi:antirestriction protein ArdC